MNIIFIGTLFQILVRNIFGKGLRYLFLINSNLKLCVLLGSTNGANIPLKDEGSISFIYLYIKVVIQKSKYFLNDLKPGGEGNPTKR